MCFATRASCERSDLRQDEACVQRPSAWCSYECQDRRGCITTCAVDRSVCGGSAVECLEQPPPARPELFPSYHRAGWWCSDEAPDSHCAKSKQDCEAALDLRGNSRGECKRPTGKVFCAAVTVEGQREFVCTASVESCARVRPATAEACLIWPYD